MTKPQCDLSEIVQALKSVDVSEFGPPVMFSPNQRTIVPFDVVIGSSEGKLSLALKYYEIIEHGLDSSGIDRSLKELIRLDDEETFGNFGWVVGYSKQKAGTPQTRVLRVNIWDHDNPLDYSSQTFEHPRTGRRKTLPVSDSSESSRFSKELVTIGIYERLIWKKFLGSERKRSDVLAYLANFYSPGVQTCE
jgi:hypothetical protein